MFQYTRELIINDCAGKLKAGDRGQLTFTIYSDDAAAKSAKFATSVNAKDADSKVLYIDNFINIDTKFNTVRSCTFAAPVDPVKETAVVDLTGITADAVKAGDVIRLVVTLTQEGRVISTYNDQYPDHKNRIFGEGVAAADGDIKEALAECVKGLKKADVRMDNKLAEVAIDDTKAALVVACLDEFTRIAEIKIVKVGTDVVPSGALLTGYGDHVVLFDKTREALTATELLPAATATVDGVAVKGAIGDLGAGTTNILIRNNRLLTDSHLDPYGAHRDERPVPGGKYTQFLIEVVTKRDHMGHQVFGSVGDESLTSLVIFALEKPAEKLKEALTAIGVTPEEFKRSI